MLYEDRTLNQRGTQFLYYIHKQNDFPCCCHNSTASTTDMWNITKSI
jgi:hypothetical protein